MHRLTVQDRSEHLHKRTGSRVWNSQPLQPLGWGPSAGMHLQSLLLCLFPSTPEPSHWLPKRLDRHMSQLSWSVSGQVYMSCFPCVSELRNQGLAQSPVLFVRSSLSFSCFMRNVHTHIHTCMHICAVADVTRLAHEHLNPLSHPPAWYKGLGFAHRCFLNIQEVDISPSVSVPVTVDDTVDGQMVLLAAKQVPWECPHVVRRVGEGPVQDKGG